MKGGIFSTSIGHKLVMSITGLFLMLFLLVHLTMNLTLMLNGVSLFGTTWGEGELYNVGAHFMISNPLVRIMEPLLAAGFIFHIVYATIITLRNRTRRPIGYASTGENHLTSWSSKNMYILGFMLLCFLALHIMHFFYDIRFTSSVPTVVVKGVEMENTYVLVKSLFTQGTLGYIYSFVYVVAAVLLGLHLSHGFWSAFQTVGLNGRKWIGGGSGVGLCFDTNIFCGCRLIEKGG